MILSVLLASALWVAPASAAEMQAPIPALPATSIAALPPSLAATTPLASGDLMLARAAALGVPAARVAEAIQVSASLQQATAGLQSLGLIKDGEFRADNAGDVVSLRAALQTVWRETSAAAPAPEVDASLPVAAFVVRGGGVEYHVHGVAHGQLAPPQGRRVRSLVRTLESRGVPLYAEQNIPRHYGFSYGRETLDHAVLQGGGVSFKDHAPAKARATADELIARWGAPLAAAAASLFAALHPGPGSILVAVFLSALAYVTRQGGLPINRLKTLYYARQARSIGEEDLARHFAGLARLFRARADVRDLRAAELPMPLKAEGVNTAERSRKIAEAIAADAQARGAKVVHLLYGINHADELAHYLGL